MAQYVPKWAAGSHYGPVLTQTDLYLLASAQPLELQINPILTKSSPDFSLVFNLCTGSTGGFSESADRDLPFTAVHEPATLPRVQEIVIISEHSPWCTIVKNEDGVTLGDICNQMWKDYTEHTITEGEFTALPPRLQETVKRANAVNGGWGGPGQFYSPAPNPGRYKRVDWLRDRLFFESMGRDGDYIKSRLGYNAPNIFVVKLTAF